ncbi:hypothetical protein SNL152K_10749 [Streptomyces sp. NL15-2K]|nr:hypothetical protein SNL152K_10749 [Streptomyces sp. NL15-2K]
MHTAARDHVPALIEEARAQGAEVLPGGSADGLHLRLTGR